MTKQRSALVIMNQQIGFINEATEHLPDRIGELLDTVCFESVFFTQFIHQPHAGGFSALPGWHGFTHDDPEAGLVPQFIRQAEHRTFTTSGFGFPRSVLSQFCGTPVDTVYLAGVETDSTILKSAFDLFETSYRPIVLADYCASCGGTELHRGALALLRRHIGEDQVRSGRLGMLR